MFIFFFFALIICFVHALDLKNSLVPTEYILWVWEELEQTQLCVKFPLSAARLI